MHKQWRSLFSSLILITVIAAQGIAFEPLWQTPSAQSSSLVGRWRVKFMLSGIGEKNLIFEARDQGSGSFLLLDSGPDNKLEAAPAVWSQTTNNRVGFSGEVELPFGTCCREIGTLILKGKFDSGNSIKGRAIFIGSTVDEENFTGYRSTLGTFTATRILKD